MISISISIEKYLEDEKNRKHLKKRLEFKQSNYQPTWEHYYSCYSYTLEKIFSIGFEKKYPFNCRAKALLFLMRHNFELFLKYNLELNNKKIPKTHDFEEIFKSFEGIEMGKFKQMINKIDFDDDGSCYRYEKAVQFGNENRIEIIELIKEFNEVNFNEKIQKKSFCKPFNYLSRVKRWDLTFHMNESLTLKQIRIQYNWMINFLVEGISNKEIEIENSYLPLLFLIRHSLELGLKQKFLELNKNSIKIETIQGLKPIESIEKLKNEHSLVKLYNHFDRYLTQIDISKMSKGNEVEYKELKGRYEYLKERVHILDNKSYHFRFPIDLQRKKHSIKLTKVSIFEILELYSITDKFISFIIYVLKEDGLIIDYEDFYNIEELYRY